MRGLIIIVALLGCGSKQPARPAPTPTAAPAPTESTSPPPSAWLETEKPEERSTNGEHADDVRMFMKQHRSEIAACLTSPADAHLTIRFTVGEDGRVLRSKAGGEQRRFEDCIADALASAVFPRSPGAGVIVVSFPWNVDPRP